MKEAERLFNLRGIIFNFFNIKLYLPIIIKYPLILFVGVLTFVRKKCSEKYNSLFIYFYYNIKELYWYLESMLDLFNPIMCG